MDRYKLLKELGDGTCGTVYKAVNRENYEIVAVKKMKRKFYFWEECVNLREVKSLRRMSHPNIIKLKEVVREINNELFFIFEYMECNLYHLMKERQIPFSEEDIRNLLTQVLQGLAHMHRNGYFHRDLKPENLLVTNDVIKIADFGLARELSSMPPYTDYVSTRWYRAPEVLLKSSTYTPAIDMWAIGAVMAELFTLCPIFPGESEIDQLYKICSILGAPNWSVFPDAKNYAQLANICHSQILPVNLADIIPNASWEAVDLISQLCSWDPLKRPTAEQALQHPFFNVASWVPRPMHDPLQNKPEYTKTKPNLDLNLWDFDSKPDDCFLGLSLAVNPGVSALGERSMLIVITIYLEAVTMSTRLLKTILLWCASVSGELRGIMMGLLLDFSSCLLKLLIFLANKEMGPSVSGSTRQDIYFCSNFQDHPEQSVFWSLFSPCRNGTTPPVDPSLSLSFSSMTHPPIGVPHSGSALQLCSQEY